MSSHPLSGLTGAQVRDRARQALSQSLALWQDWPASEGTVTQTKTPLSGRNVPPDFTQAAWISSTRACPTAGRSAGAPPPMGLHAARTSKSPPNTKVLLSNMPVSGWPGIGATIPGSTPNRKGKLLRCQT